MDVGGSGPVMVMGSVVLAVLVGVSVMAACVGGGQVVAVAGGEGTKDA